ncbi:2-oxoacid:acceptor oxidoreductase subunit alpha [Thermodesulforhabdus norvegica]|uniref:2-oxoglutarate ferredoxin oxidoreductase, alpha subunit n=1 Tax=Thermodesulforhabdus norvegica TaxID=39841 RepID=A0A1I4R3M0_9BACT|nr:2-oxoacid:acceptor oxidoreductase subunit alpha [Thermodesulforhabdus norvegica]SFM46851.1 2-oxoglutarate ferredoxin oxidoreductase, alpha subunit [Thermodesulforhabdus norvegica]
MNRVLTGTYFEMGNWTCAEGALAAGCSFCAAYPITPASEIANRLARRLPEVGGVFIQMEDEIGAVCAAIGASWAGKKAMTVTSGPGISLMQENIGYAASTEAPLVIVDVQRLGPSTGVPSVGVAGDMVQVARGSHGDYQIIALAPESPQEMFDLTIHAFNLAERYRVPVFVMADAFVGHMRERVRIPDEKEIKIWNRKVASKAGSVLERRDFLDIDVAPMPVFGLGLKAHVTGSCHDEHGMRNLSDPEVMHRYVMNPIKKIITKIKDITMVEDLSENSPVVLLSYGSVARSAKATAVLARQRGMKLGVFRLITCWPFPEEEIVKLSQRCDEIVVLENNSGQMYPYIRAVAASNCRVRFIEPEIIGQIHSPEYILSKLGSF